MPIEASSCEKMLAALRQANPPVVARAHEGHVVFDVRTIPDEDFPAIAAAVQAARSA